MDWVRKSGTTVSALLLVLGVFITLIAIFLPAPPDTSMPPSRLTIVPAPAQQAAQAQDSAGFPPPYRIFVTGRLAVVPPVSSAANAPQGIDITGINISSVQSANGTAFDNKAEAIEKVDPARQQILKEAITRLNNGSLRWRLRMPGATVSPEKADLKGDELRFFPSPSENETAELPGTIVIDSPPADDMHFLFSGASIKLAVEEHHDSLHSTYRENLIPCFRFLGPAFILSGIVGFVWVGALRKGKDR